MDNVRIIEVKRSVFENNDRDADLLRAAVASASSNPAYQKDTPNTAT